MLICSCVYMWLFILRIRRPPRSTRTVTLLPDTTLVRSRLGSVVGDEDLLTSLHRALLNSGVSLIEASPTQTLAAGHVEFDLGEDRLRSILAVQSDGARPRGVERHYGQAAEIGRASCRERVCP